jgi:hypothetical protein
MDETKEKLGLLISHNLFLTQNQRYTLVRGNPITVVGVSLPVWFTNKTGKSTEPANEVFCNYKISVKNGPLAMCVENGYDINLPPRNKSKKPTDDEWKQMSDDEKESWYNDNQTNNVDNLRDISDNGSEYLRLEEQKTMIVSENLIVSVVHILEIKKIEDLENSFL